MLRNIFTRMEDIQTFGIVSICLFVSVFIGAIGVALLAKKSFVNSMSALPLNDDTTTSSQHTAHE